MQRISSQKLLERHVIYDKRFAPDHLSRIVRLNAYRTHRGAIAVFDLHIQRLTRSPGVQRYVSKNARQRTAYSDILDPELHSPVVHRQPQKFAVEFVIPKILRGVRDKNKSNKHEATFHEQNL